MDNIISLWKVVIPNTILNMLLSLADNSEVKEEIVAGYGEAEDLSH